MKQVAFLFIFLVILCNKVLVPAVYQQAEQTKLVCSSVKQHRTTEVSKPATDVFFPSLLIMD